MEAEDKEHRGQKRRALTQVERALLDPERLDGTKKTKTCQAYLDEEYSTMDKALSEAFFTSDYKMDLTSA